MNNSLAQLADELLKLENHFRELIKISDRICEQYGKTDEQYKQASLAVNETLYEMLHETGSNIGFFREDINLLIKYIAFTKQFYDFTDLELGIIIDKEDLSLKDKQLIFKSKNTDKDILVKQMALLKKEWNKRFNNISYAKVRGRLKYFLH